MPSLLALVHAAVARLLLPPGFHQRFGAEIRDGFAARLRALPAVARPRAFAAAIADLARTAAAEWARGLWGALPVVAMLMPARKALRTDPVVVLRGE